jgi:Tol biopolymer transport system component
MRIKIATYVALVALFTATFLTAQQPNARALFDQARAKKAAGDLQGATEGFEKVISDFASSDRNSVAKALLELGDIFESLGQAGRARSSYERVRNEFKDQTAEANTATDRLTQLANRLGPTAPGGQPNAPGAGPSKITIKTPYADDVYSFAISPDGRMLVFQGTSPDGKKQLWRQAVDDSRKPEPIAGTEGAGASAFPFFSPDGKTIGYFANHKLWRIDLAGGSAKEVADAPNPWGASWRGDSIIMSGRGLGGQIELVADGRVRPLTSISGFLLSPRFIDDRRFLFFSRDNNGFGKIQVASIDGSLAAAQGLPAAHAATFTQGHLVYVNRAGILNALLFDPANLTVTGSPTILAEHVGREDRLAGVAAFAASAAGPIAYREGAVAKKQMLWMNRSGDLVGLLGTADTAAMGSPRVSPDGRTVLFFRQVGAPLGSVWAIDVESGQQRMLQDAATTAIWSPTGDRIIFSMLRNGAIPTLVMRPANALSGSGAGQIIATSGPSFPEDLAQNGALLYRAGTGSGAGGGGDLMVIPPNQATPTTVAQTPAAERLARFSPDGNWIAYQSDEGGHNEVYVQPFPGTIAQRQRVSLNGGLSPQWGRKGRELYFISADNHLMVATAEASVNGDRRSIEFTTPKPLFNAPVPPGAEYDTVGDGDRFLIIAPVEDTPPIIVLSNWIPAR